MILNMIVMILNVIAMILNTIVIVLSVESVSVSNQDVRRFVVNVSLFVVVVIENTGNIFLMRCLIEKENRKICSPFCIFYRLYRVCYFIVFCCTSKRAYNIDSLIYYYRVC